MLIRNDPLVAKIAPQRKSNRCVQALTLAGLELLAVSGGAIKRGTPFI
jgi:hypothetical protein